MKFNKNYSIIALCNEKQEFFIQDRRSISKRGEDYGFFGGGVEEGESFEEALAREAKEELDIDISGNFVHVGDTVLNLEGSGTQETRIYEVKYLPEYDFTMKVLEGDGGKFMTLEELAGLRIAPWTHMAIEMLEEYYK